ncbi:PREDICTED: superoxide dismutase [Mn], mitochondrial [Nipponia nippon]|nr:PREDICTED: superoxide dismutase [Mn], mitochondrial [Nipponia nippon]
MSRDKCEVLKWGRVTRAARFSVLGVAAALSSRSVRFSQYPPAGAFCIVRQGNVPGTSWLLFLIDKDYFCFFSSRSGAKLIAPLGCLVSRQKHTLPDLPYDYGALEPHISAEIMQLHHSKHHATYVNNLNVAEEKYKEALAKGDVTAQVSLQPAVKFNGGGHINHTIFWTNLSPTGGGEPKGELMEAIKRDFGSFANFKEKLTAVSVGVQGSGWGWLGYNKEQGRLQIAACANQDPLQGTTGLIPLLGIDVWEHAYYLQYKNVRPDYLKAIWNVINWENVSSRYATCKK